MLTASTIAIIPRLFTTSAFAYDPGTWRIKLQDLGNNTVPAGSVTVYLWNLTERTIAPVHPAWPIAGPVPCPYPAEQYLLSYATVGADGIVTFPGLPGDTWNKGTAGINLQYAISGNYTLADGTVTDILVLPLLRIFNLGGGGATMISLAGLLNDTTAVINHHFTWEDLAASETVKTRPGYITFLAPMAFRVIDEAGFPLVGAGFEVWAQVWTDTAHTLADADFIQLSAAIANGTFGSEFIGNMPYAVPLGYPIQVRTTPFWTGSHNVGWVKVVVPALFHDEDMLIHNFAWDTFGTWTGLENVTFIVRYKTSDPTVGPIVGRFYTESIDSAANVVWAPVHGTDTDPLYDTIGADIKAFLGTEIDALKSGEMYPYVWSNVRWKYENLTDVMHWPDAGAIWLTKEAEVFMKWEQGPIGSFQFVGTNVAPGRVLMRYPCNVENAVHLVGDTGYEFTLALGVEWRFSIVNFTQGIHPEDLPHTLPGEIDNVVHYGLIPGTNKGNSDFGHMNDHDWVGEGGNNISSNVLVCNMTYIKGIKLDSSTEVPQALRNEIALKIILPAGIAHTINASIAWVTNNTGFVTLPDTTALRTDSDIYELLWWTTDKYSLNMVNDLNFSGWLPIVYHGQTNFLAWFKGIKVLDTTVDGGYPAGNLPLPLGSKAVPTLHYGMQWNYSLAIYELGFVLEFSPGPKDETRPVPYYTPFFFRYPNGELIGPTITVPASEEEQGYGIYDLVKAAPGGTYSDFMIVWKGAVIRASNVQSITLDDNRNNTLLVFPVYDLNVTGWSQDPFVLVDVKVQLFSETDFAQFGLPFYIVRMLVDPEAAWYSAVLPAGWVYNATIGAGGFPIWEYATGPEWVQWSGVSEEVLPAMFEKLPAKDYDIWISTSEDTGIWGTEGKTALGAGFRSVDINATLYWTRDPWIGAPYSLTGHAALDIDTYVYNPRLSIEDAGGAPLELALGSQSAIFLVEPWYDSAPDFYDHKVADEFNPYFVRINSTDATGHATLESVNATAIDPPTDPHFDRLADDFPEESRYLVGTSTFHPADPYRFMVYYKGVLVFNESVPLQNPYISKDHPIITSVYPYIFKVTNYPLPDETWRFGIQNLDVDVFWAGLNLTWWPSFSLVTETAVKEFSLLNASKLEKGFNMSVLERLWGPTPVNPVTLIEIPYTPVPPFFCSNLFVESGVSDEDGEFRVLVPVWNYSYSSHTFTFLASDVVAGTWSEIKVGGPAMPWVKALGPLGITLPTWAMRQRVPQGFFGTPVYANWTTIPGTTNNIPADDIVRLAATLEPAWLALEQDHIWPNVFSVNATGLVNTETYYGDTPADDIVKSLNTTSRAPAELWGGIGMLSGGVFQGRQAIDIFEDTVVGPPQPYANFYAKLQVMTIANDIAVVVLDSPDFSGGGVLGFGNDLPNQYVEVWNLGDADVDIEALMFHGYTPLDSPSILYIESTPTNILWGFYNFEVATTNLTQVPTHDLEAEWELDPQWLVAELPGGSIDWWSWEVFLQWPTKLQVTVYAGDAARYLDNAWVFIVDAVTNDNITAALTDDAGYPNSIDLTDPALVTAWQFDPLATGNPSGSRLNLGFNLGYEDWAYVIDAPFGDIIVNCTSGSGKWIVKVFWKAPDAGAVKTFGKVEGVSVWDTFRDQPQHRYIYLGVDMPNSATGEDNATCQVRTFNTKVYDLKLKVLDQSPSARAIVSAPVTITMPDASPAWVMSKTTTAAGEVTLNLVPAGKYQIVATSPVALFGKPASQIVASVEARVIDAPATINVPLPIFDATVTLVTPSGKPIVGATLTVGGVALGMTDAAGNVLAASIPSGSYTVTSAWYGQDISPTVPLTVTLSRTYLLTASKIALVQIQVVGAQNQGLPQAAVTIKIGTTTVFTGMTNNDGVAALELPYGTYSVTASHKGVEATATIAVTGDTVQKITTGVFIELFGQGLTFAGFALWVIAILIVVLILVIAAQEYNIYRRKRLPQLFGAGPTR